MALENGGGAGLIIGVLGLVEFRVANLGRQDFRGLSGEPGVFGIFDLRADAIFQRIISGVLIGDGGVIGNGVAAFFIRLFGAHVPGQVRSRLKDAGVLNAVQRL